MPFAFSGLRHVIEVRQSLTYETVSRFATTGAITSRKCLSARNCGKTFRSCGSPATLRTAPPDQVEVVLLMGTMPPRRNQIKHSLPLASGFRSRALERNLYHIPPQRPRQLHVWRSVNSSWPKNDERRLVNTQMILSAQSKTMWGYRKY